MRNPQEIFEETLNSGVGKAACSLLPRAGLTFLAGMYIAIGGFLAIRVGGNLPPDMWGSMTKLVFAVVFPIGLMLTVICGADLFTGNCMTLTASCSYKKITPLDVIKGWAFSWGGNFVGALFVAYFLAYQSGLIFNENGVWAGYTVNLANAKCNLSFGEAFWRGVGCNWLVCLGVYAATAAKDVTGKIVALWIPTTAFVALGMEHCIANMFFIPLGILTGNNETYLAYENLPELTANWQNFLIDNMIPVTLGNIAGGAVLVAGIYGMVYSKKCRCKKD